MLFEVDELLQIAYQDTKAETNNNVHVFTFTRDQLAKWRKDKRNEVYLTWTCLLFLDPQGERCS